MWKSTTEVGFGVATRGNYTVGVALYYQAGNVIGRFKQNVQPRIRTVEQQVRHPAHANATVAANLGYHYEVLPHQINGNLYAAGYWYSSEYGSGKGSGYGYMSPQNSAILSGIDNNMCYGYQHHHQYANSYMDQHLKYFY